MPPHESAAGDLALHGLRVLGYAEAPRIAGRYGPGPGPGTRSWPPDRDSCHLVWIQFHEDLLATLGLDRGPGR